MAQRHQIVCYLAFASNCSQGRHSLFCLQGSFSNKTITHIRKLEETERIAEIAKMIGGAGHLPWMENTPRRA